MKFEIVIDKEKLENMVHEMIVNQIQSVSHTYESNEAKQGVRRGVEQGVKEYIYAKKDEIIEKVIERASIEIVKKALPKLMDKLNKEV